MKIGKLLFLPILMFGSCLFSQVFSGSEYIGTLKATEKVYSMKQKYGKDISELISKNAIEYDVNGIAKAKYQYLGNDTSTGKIVYTDFPAQKMSEDIEYNSMNQVVEKRRKQILFTNQDFIQTRFDRNGSLIAKTESVYDSVAHKRTETYYNVMGTVDSYSIFKTDKYGRDVERHYFDYDGYNTLNASFSYNSLGNLEVTKEFDEQGKLKNTFVYQYDSKGHLTNVGYYREDGFQYKKEAYIYDKLGRILEYDRYESTDSFGGATRLVESRKYEYTLVKK
jgi:hypothetical protein